MKHEPKHLDDDLAIVLTEKHEVLFQKCCDCGLWHEWLFKRRNGDILLSCKRIEGEPDWDKYEINAKFEKIGFMNKVKEFIGKLIR